jgi:transcriptional regulator with XRE-family HTH domain
VPRFAHQMKLTEGQQIALRREALDWNQPELAGAVGVSASTISRLEGDDPRVSKHMKAAVIAALDKEERKRGLRGPTLSTPPSTTASPTEEGVDAITKLRELRASLQRIEALLVDSESAVALALRHVRRELDSLSEDTIEHYRKSG